MLKIKESKNINVVRGDNIHDLFYYFSADQK